MNEIEKLWEERAKLASAGYLAIGPLIQQAAISREAAFALWMASPDAHTYGRYEAAYQYSAALHDAMVAAADAGLAALRNVGVVTAGAGLRTSPFSGGTV